MWRENKEKECPQGGGEGGAEDEAEAEVEGGGKGIEKAQVSSSPTVQLITDAGCTPFTRGCSHDEAMAAPLCEEDEGRPP